MRITKNELRTLVKEEISRMIDEGEVIDFPGGSKSDKDKRNAGAPGQMAEIPVSDFQRALNGAVEDMRDSDEYWEQYDEPEIERLNRRAYVGLVDYLTDIFKKLYHVEIESSDGPISYFSDELIAMAFTDAIDIAEIGWSMKYEIKEP